MRIHALKTDRYQPKQRFVIPRPRLNDEAYIKLRVSQVPRQDQGAVRTTLRYLYIRKGPTNLPRDRLKAAERYLEPAEAVVARWLYTRTNGRLRPQFGSRALSAARLGGYRCKCGFDDVRALNLDHIDGREPSTSTFACLCANCHAIKSRAKDWKGIAKKR